VAAHDPNDNVELLDDFFPGCEFFKEGSDFESYLTSTPIDYLVVCSPTHLHYEQVKMGLICGIIWFTYKNPV
jgi:UDP-N-acetyl-2-amino-2-deoxyglucuronate dehydrogenase